MLNRRVSFSGARFGRPVIDQYFCWLASTALGAVISWSVAVGLHFVHRILCGACLHVRHAWYCRRQPDQLHSRALLGFHELPPKSQSMKNCRFPSGKGRRRRHAPQGSATQVLGGVNRLSLSRGTCCRIHTKFRSLRPRIIECRRGGTVSSSPTFIGPAVTPPRPGIRNCHSIPER